MLKLVFVAASCHMLNPFIRGPIRDAHMTLRDFKRNTTNCPHVTAPSTPRSARHNDVKFVTLLPSTHGAAGITENRRKPANKTAFINENADEDVWKDYVLLSDP